MNPSDIKKFIAGFLILASVSSIGVLLFSDLGNAKTDLAQQGTKGTQNNVQQLAAAQNAFVEDLPQSGAPDPFPTPQNAAADPTNLTDNIAGTLAAKIIAQNPEGPIDAGNGAKSVSAPDVDNLIAATFANPSQYLKSAPDWDSEVASYPVKTTGTTKENEQEYLVGLGTIFQKYLNHSGLTGLTIEKIDSDPQSVDLSGLDMKGGAAELAKLSVPESLGELHKNVLRVFVYAKNALALQAKASEDPMKAALIAQAYETRYFDAVAKMQTGIQAALGRIAYMETSQPEKQNIIAKVLGIPTAHAQFFASIVFDPQVFAALTAQTTISTVRSVWEWVQKFLLDFVKDRIIHTLVQQVITWIQGGGSPQFITNWRGFLGDAFNVAAGEAINHFIPGICQPFSLQIRYFLESTYLANSAPVSCTLDSLVSNITNFYDDFSQGGWLAYGGTILPAGNFFGSLFEADQYVSQQAEKRKEAAKTDAQAAGGFTSSRVCVAFKTKYQDCLDRHYGERDHGVLSCNQFSQSTETVCTQYEVTTPGQALGQQTYNALSSPIQRIVNAQDLRALASALINSMLSQLISIGQRGILGLNANANANTDTCLALTGDAFLECERAIACQELSGEDREQCEGDWQSPSSPQQCTPVGGSPFGSAQCGGFPSYPNCGGPSDGSLAYDLRVGHIDMDQASRKLYNAGTGGPFTEWEWSVAPPLSNERAWCEPNFPLVGTSPPAQAPVQPPTVRCPDGSDGGYTPPTLVCTPGTSTSTTPGGGENCNGGSPGPCNCRTRDNILLDQFCFVTPVTTAQNAVMSDWQSGALSDAAAGLVQGPYTCGDPSQGPTTVCQGVCVTDGLQYAKAVAAKLNAAGLATPGLDAPPGEEGFELSVVGDCSLPPVSGQAGPVPASGGARQEQYALSSSACAIRMATGPHVAIAICPVGTQ